MVAEFACEESIEKFGGGIALSRVEFILVVHGAQDIRFGAVGGDGSPNVDS